MFLGILFVYHIVIDLSLMTFRLYTLVIFPSHAARLNHHRSPTSSRHSFASSSVSISQFDLSTARRRCSPMILLSVCTFR